MNNKVAFIIPYFGSFPNYFDLWLKSAHKNLNFDFYIFTDNNYKSRDNIKFVKTTFSEFKKALQSQIEFPICLNEPYKLVDYKPVYGAAFQKYISEYKFWGYCDVDEILGNLSTFITQDKLDKYDKLYELGHMTILKNNEKCNYLWKKKHHIKGIYRYDEAFRTPYTCHFDEMGGLSIIAEKEGLKIYKSIDFADIDQHEFNFFLIGKQKKLYPGLFNWSNGTLKYYYLENNNIKDSEVIYAHFQKRKMQFSSNELDNFDSFLAVPNKFIINGSLEKYLKNQKIKTYYPTYKKTRLREIVHNIKNHALQQRIYRLCFRSLYRYYLDKRR